MLLAIDIGNTDLVLGVHQEEQWQHLWRIKSLPDEPSYFYETRIKNHFLEAGLRFDEFDTVVMSSVVPLLSPTIAVLLQQLFGFDPIVLGPELFQKIPFGIPKPYEIGSDLVANAVAAHHQHQRNLVVVDFGTALTFTTVGASGAILGIAIAPGLHTAIQSLASNTAQLPEVALKTPSSALGLDTAHAIQAGVLMGCTGLVKHLIKSIRQELGGDCVAVATGGLSSVLDSLQDEFIEVNKELTLNGLKVIGQMARDLES